MTTLAVMKARIADEIARDDLTSQIAFAINDAIVAYDDEEFRFNETRNLTFNTVAGQEIYTATDAAFIGRIEKLHYITALIGDSTPIKLMPMFPDEIELASSNATQNGDPSNYCLYSDSLRFYPVPTRVIAIRVGANVRIAAPATDGELNNPWMNTAERLIRCRAKFELYKHVIRNSAKADEMVPLVDEAFEQLKDRAWKANRVGENQTVEAMDF